MQPYEIWHAKHRFPRPKGGYRFCELEKRPEFIKLISKDLIYLKRTGTILCYLIYQAVIFKTEIQGPGAPNLIQFLKLVFRDMLVAYLFKLLHLLDCRNLGVAVAVP